MKIYRVYVQHWSAASFADHRGMYFEGPWILDGWYYNRRGANQRVRDFWNATDWRTYGVATRIVTVEIDPFRPMKGR